MSNQKIIKKKEDQDREIDPELLNKNLSTFFERKGELLTKKEFEWIQDLTMRGKSLESEIDSYRSDLKISSEDEEKMKYRHGIRTAINHLRSIVTDSQKNSYETNIKLAGFSQIEREGLPVKLLEFLNMFLERGYIRSKQDFVNRIHRNTFFKELYRLIEKKEDIVYLGNDKEVLEILRELLTLKNNNDSWTKRNANYKDLILIAAQTAIRYYKENYQLAECQDCGKYVFKTDLVEAWYRSNNETDFSGSDKYFICRECVVKNADQIYDVYPVKLPKEPEVISKAKIVRFLENEIELANDELFYTKDSEKRTHAYAWKQEAQKILKAINDFRRFKEVEN